MSTFSWISLRDNPHEFFITMGDGIEEGDLEFFFDYDPSKIDENSRTHYRHFDRVLTYEELAVELQQMSSKGEARKNNWKGKVPYGFTEFKRKFHRFYILNKTAKENLEIRIKYNI